MHAKHHKFAEDLRLAGIDREIQVLDEHTKTAADAAAFVGCQVAAIANSLVFECDGEPLLIMSSGAGKVDTALVAKALNGAVLKRATPNFVKQATGQVIGGVAPAGHPAKLRTLIDTSLREHAELWVAAGTANSLMPISYDELLRLTGGTELQVR